MTSTVRFRMQQGSEFTVVSFSGAEIKLLELKRAIVDKKYAGESNCLKTSIICEVYVCMRVFIVLCCTVCYVWCVQEDDY